MPTHNQRKRRGKWIIRTFLRLRYTLQHQLLLYASGLVLLTSYGGVVLSRLEIVLEEEVGLEI